MVGVGSQANFTRIITCVDIALSGPPRVGLSGGWVGGGDKGKESKGEGIGKGQGEWGDFKVLDVDPKFVPNLH